MRRSWLGLFLTLLACEPVPPEGRFVCDTDDDCPDAMVCRLNVRRCHSTANDDGGDSRDR